MKRVARELEDILGTDCTAVVGHDYFSAYHTYAYMNRNRSQLLN